MMNDLYDIAPIAYVGNNKFYKDLSKEELDELKKKSVKKEALPSSEEVEESSASVIGPMLPQVGLTETEEPSFDDMLADINEDSELMKEYFDGTSDDTCDMYTEGVKFIEDLKNKFKNKIKIKVDSDKDEVIDTSKIQKAIDAFAEVQYAKYELRVNGYIPSYKKDAEKLAKNQKQIIDAEKEYHKIKAELSEAELRELKKHEKEIRTSVSIQLKDSIEDTKNWVKNHMDDLKKDNFNESVDMDYEILTESLNDDINGGEILFEKASFIENLKNKFKKNDANTIERGKVMRAAKAYTEMKLATSRVKLATVKDSKVKGTSEYRELQKKAITAEKEFRKLRKALNNDEAEALNNYIKGFDSTFNEKLKKNIADIKDSKKVTIKKESCETECGTTEIITEKDIDPGMKPLLEKLHRKGYKTKASSSGHRNVITKDDGDKDNVRNGHHYGDARLVFDGKYDLGKAPKYWYWKKVENSDEVEYLDVEQISGIESPDNDEKFNKWKTNYMKSLTDWVDDLPDISNGKKEDVEESCHTESTEDIDTQIDTLYESVMGSLEFDLLDI